MDKQYIGISLARRVRKKGQHGQASDFREVQHIVYGGINSFKGYETLRSEGFMEWLSTAYINFKLHQTDTKN